MKATVIREAHDSAIGGHLGVAKTVEVVSRDFYWPKLIEEVKEYVSSCPSCQINKSRTENAAGLLHPLPHPPRRWQQVSMDLITQLPPTLHHHDAIFVVVDKCSKMIHCIPTTTSVTAPELAQLFFREIVRHHGLPTSIISDRDPRFTSSFWTELWKQFGTRLAMSTAYHPQTDGQTERANRTIEQMLRSYVNVQQNDWDQHLTAIEIAYNNSKQASTGYSPFFLNSGQHPFFPLTTSVRSESDQYSNATAEQMIEDLLTHLNWAEENIKKAQQQQIEQTNKHRKQIEFETGQKVWLSTSDLRHRIKITPKLSSHWIGPFRIKRKLSPLNYELELPNSFSIHPVFHISKLRLYNESERFDSFRPPLPDRPPPEIVVEGAEAEYEVEAIRQHREKKWRGQLYKQYLVKWKGYPEWENTWEWEYTITNNAKEIVESYEQSIIQEEQ